MSLGAIVLCGGRSLRMGRPKAWLPFGPERLLTRVVRLVGEAVGPVVVVAGPGQDWPDLPADTIVMRDAREGLGPLAGIASGLEAIGGDTALVYATATDAPFLAPRWVARLAELIGDADLAIPRIEGQLHPLAALYRRETIGPIVRSLRDRGRSRLLDLADAARSREVGADELRAVDPDLATLRNVNTPDEYRAALLLAGFSD
ncbi:MAG TPA: molybdenum cofactor guanylyltransferase [Isosphaeraceae bacterium]